MNQRSTSTFVLCLGFFLTACSQVNVSGLNPDLFTNSGNGGDSPTSALCEGVSSNFSTDVYPIFAAKCAGSGCHMDGDSGGGLNLDDGDDENGDTKSGVIGNIKSTGNIDPISPSASSLLLKPLAVAEGGSSHTGGDIFTSANDADYKTILCWIDAGADNDLSTSACTFGEHVYPIFDERGCTDSCHDSSSPSGNLNLDLSSSTLLATGFDAADDPGVVIAGDDSSLLLTKPAELSGVTHGGGKQFDDTSDADYQTIKCWIDEGAQNN